MNEEENKILNEKVKKSGLNKSEFFRKIILDYQLKEKPDEKFYEVLSQLRGMATNLNQIARKANALDIVDAPFYKKVYEKWNRLSEDIKKEFLDMEK